MRKPRDKPRVERSVPYVRERLFKGAQFRDLAELRDAARRWCLEVAGQRIHGTTRKRPLEVFQDEERPLLAPWDGEPYEVPDWRTAKVHADHHVACQYALYSVPSELCPPGQQVEVQLGAKLVRIYHRGALLKVHPRQPRGGRATDPNDYPAELSPYTLRAPDQLQRRAAEFGEATGAYAERLDLVDVRRLERILVEALEQETTVPQQPLPPPPGRFARPGAVFALTATQTTTGASR